MKGENMYKIICLLMKYVKLSLLNELLVQFRSNLIRCQENIRKDNCNDRNNFLAGNIRAYGIVCETLEKRIQNIKEGVNDTRSNQ